MDDENQDKYLDDAKKMVKEKAYFMRKALDQANLRDGLKSAAQMLQTLKTSDLTPKNYYSLFMQIFDELRDLEGYFKEEYRRGRNILALYETVQHATGLIPRLYLLITVGSVYIQTHEVPAKEILNDLLEMIKAVQHPLRGMFLRYYFLKMCKERLPDKGSEYEGEGGDINDAIDIILRNLSEMNKLWIRMGGKSYKGPGSSEKQRVDLKMLVGENIIRLSDLEGVNQEVYQTIVLPKIFEIVLNSKDHVSQAYLMDCAIQAFPDEYHLATLEELLLCTTTKLDPKVDIKNIFIRLMDRLAGYAENQEQDVTNMFGDIDIYSMFKTNIDRLIETANATEFKNVLDLMVAFLKFTIRCYKENADNVNNILKSCVKVCGRQHSSDFDNDCLKNLVKFLTLPLQSMSLQVLTMDEYPNLMKYLPFEKRRQVSYNIVQAVVTSKVKLNDQSIVNQLISFITPLLVSEEDYVENNESEFEREQKLVCKVFHLIEHDEPKQTWRIMELFMDKFREGGLKRQKFTFSACFFATAKLARQFYQNKVELKYETLFNMMKEFIDVLAPENPFYGIQLYLQLSLVINEIDDEKQFDEFTYEIVSQALLMYEEELNLADQKRAILIQITGTINQLKCLSEENMDTLASNATQFASKLLKKPEQVISVLRCTHLFFNQHMQDETNTFSCFKKCIKVAGTCLKSGVQNIGLYVHILNKFLYFWQNVSVKAEDVQQIIDTIKQNIVNLPNDLESELIQVYWENTIASIKQKQSKGIEGLVDLQV